MFIVKHIEINLAIAIRGEYNPFIKYHIHIQVRPYRAIGETH